MHPEGVVTVDGIANNINLMMNLSATREGEASSRATAGAETANLGSIIDEARLSSLSPRLRNVLGQISEQGGSAIEALENNVSSLQGGFISTLHAKLEEAGIDLSEKLTLRLDEPSQLVVASSHPQAEAVQKILDASPELGEAFGEIASQSEIIRDIGNIQRVLSTRGGVAQYAQEDARDTGPSSYQVSLKGAMSHFCFTRNS
ncbi:hypothetical protein Deval_1451 [Nitratidesulfovibrio vulgaris RCH1]|jgi:hypothetical protein|nr:hypothetical protein Deval_1451 [Nitratidesulfovibrio vulgaris RCH1]